MTGRIEGLNSEMEEKVCVSSQTLWVSDDSENRGGEAKAFVLDVWQVIGFF